MIHLSGEYPLERALMEVSIYEEFGIDGIIVENYHSSSKTVIDVLDCLKTSLEVGVNILPNEYKRAFDLSKKYNVSFIQLDYVSGKYERNKSIDEEDYSREYSNHKPIQVLGGVWPKYYTPVSNLDEDLDTAKERCDAIVVTGSGTGKVTPIEKIKYFRNHIGDFPLIIGAGMSVETIDYLDFANGAIIGSAFKKDNNTMNPVDKFLVENFMSEKYKKYGR